jgi:phage FluMu protein gp41
MKDQTASKITVKLSTGKTVTLRAKKISDSLEAAEALGENASQHPMTYSLQVGQELARRSIVAINDKPISGKDLLDLDSHFSVEEFGEVLEAVGGKRQARPTGAKFENSSGDK